MVRGEKIEEQRRGNASEKSGQRRCKKWLENIQTDLDMRRENT